MEDEPFDEAELGSTTPPPPDRMYEPARNAADFDNFPPGWEEAVVEGRKHAEDRFAEAEDPPRSADLD